MIQHLIRQPRFVLALVGSLTVALGLYLIAQDLQGLEKSRAQALEISSRSLSLLPPTSLVEDSLNTKDSESFEDRQLRRILTGAKAQLNIRGEISILGLGDTGTWQVLASTEGGPIKGEKLDFSASEVEKLGSSASFSRPLEAKDGEYWIKAWAPIEDLDGVLIGAIQVRSNETALHFQKMGFVIHYLISFIALLALALTGFFLFTQQHRQRMKQQSFTLDTLFATTDQEILVVDNKLNIIHANQSFLESLETSLEDIASMNFFGELPNAQFAAIEEGASDLLERFSEGAEFQFKTKAFIGNDRTKYFKVRAYPYRESESKKCSLFILVMENITAQVARRQGALNEDSSFIDKVTRLPNISYLDSYFQTHLEYLRAEMASLLLIDIDDFSNFNTLFGEDAGDDLLREFADFLRGYFRDSDRVIRFANDQFVILLPRTRLNKAAKIAHNLTRAGKDQAATSYVHRIDFSVGVAELDGEESAQDWLARANSALSNAKNSGKARVEAQKSNELEIVS